VLSTKPENTPFNCPQLSCRTKFPSESWQLKPIKLRNPEQLQVACRKHQTIFSVPRRAEPAQRHEFNTKKDSVEVFEAVHYREHVENIADLESQPSPPPLAWTEIYPRAGTPLSDFIAELWELNHHDCLETNLQNNPYYPFTMLEEYKYILCGIKKKGMRT
jgi:hypothetical protein